MTKRRWVGAPVLGLAALLGACAAPPALTTPAGLMPDLRGTWTGKWAGTPLTLVVLEQHDAEALGGVSVGSWQVLGRNLPAVAGILSVKIRSETVSVNVHGRLESWNGRLTLVLEPATVNGGWITLTRLDENRLAGTGTSQMSWEPQGPVELIRQPRAPAATPPA